MKKIIHVDMDCFYAAVEMRDNPAYQNVPIAVGGNGPRSVLCTCNYIARQFGVRSAMPNAQALKLCPDLIIVNGRMEVYKEVSQQIRQIFHRYTSIIEPLSLDEAFLDVSDSRHFQGSATLIAQQIRQDIFDETGLTASAGVAPNKFIAKIASDENKPNGQCVISPDKVAEFVKELPLKKIPGIGPKTAARLKLHGFESCADVRQSSVAQLTQIVGKFAESLYQRSHGIDDRDLQMDRVRKSVGIETTLAEDISTKGECLQVINQLKPKLAQRFEPHKKRKISKLGVKVKFADFTQTTVDQQSSEIDEQLFDVLLDKAMQRAQGKAIRLLGLTIGLKDAESISKSDAQLSLPIED